MDMFTRFEQFWYNGGANQVGGSYLPQGLPSSSFMGSGRGSRIAKANNIFDIGADQGIDPKYSALMPEWIKRKRNTYSLLKKTDFAVMGDAFKVWFDDPGTITDVVKGVTENEPIFDTNDRIDIQRVNGLTNDGITPKIIQCHWEEGLLHNLKQRGFQNDPKLSPERLRAAYTRLWIKQMNKMVLQDVATPAGNNLLSLDSLISGKAEATARTLTTEVDFWNLDRHTAATNADSNLDVSATTRAFDIEDLDDLLAGMYDYDPIDPFAVTSPLLLNRMERQIQAKQQFIGRSRAVIERNGIKTRVGENTGFQVTTYSGGGVKEFPVFPDSDVPTTISNSLGNFYIIDNDDAELRTALPQSFWDTGKNFSLIDANGKFKTRYLLGVVQETVISNPKKHGKLTALN